MHVASESSLMQRADTFGKIIIAVFGAIWLVLSPLGSAAEPELQVIPLKHRLADEIVPILRPLLAPGESVNGIDSRLIVRASPRSLALIRSALEEVDTARRNLRIRIRQSDERENIRQRQAVSGEIHSGTTRIITSGSRNNAGLVFERSGPNGHVRVQTERRLTTAREAADQSLTVLDGGHAFLRVGESIRQVEPYLVLVGNRLTVVAGVEYDQVTAGFDVQAHLLGDRVQLAVWPRLVFGSNLGSQTVDFQELRTVVMVTPGEWFDLGGSAGSESEVGREILLGSGQNRNDANRRFLVRVDPL